MKKCSNCGKAMQQRKAKTPEGVAYEFYRCGKCGEEVLDMTQLHNVAQGYRKLKIYRVKISKWGPSIGLRIPKELVAHYKLKGEVAIIPKEDGMLIVP